MDLVTLNADVMKYGLFQTVEVDEFGDGEPCWYVYDIYETLEEAEKARNKQFYPFNFLIMPVYPHINHEI